MKASNRRCANCRKKCAAEDALISQLKAFCSFDCLKQYTSSNQDKLVKRVSIERRKKDSERREKLKTRSQWGREAQAAVNAYVRYRDRDRSCISCGRNLKFGAVGGKVDAGHLLSRGAHPHKRYRTDNIHAQCVACNRHRSGAVDNFRVGIVWRYGQEYLDRIEAHWESPEMTIDYLKRIKDVFTRKLRHKKRLHENNC